MNLADVKDHDQRRALKAIKKQMKIEIDKIRKCACCDDVIIGCYITNEEFMLDLEEKGWVQCDGKWFCKHCAEKLGLNE